MISVNAHSKYGIVVALLLLSASLTAAAQQERDQSGKTVLGKPAVSLVILGTVQDGGAPHAGCRKDCCKRLFLHPDNNLKVVSLGLTDLANDKTWLFEATPDFSQQAKTLRNAASAAHKETPDGIFLTHAHIGHYTGLMYLGKEAMNTSEVPVYAMPRMKTFLERNGPWSQLVDQKNISLQDLEDEKEIRLSANVSVKAFTVPHRDEFSETVGYIITGPNKKALFIPDIDKWEKWKTDIRQAIAGVDYAFIDGTFYDGGEIGNRDISTIPHPFIIESMKLFADLPASERKKIYFIHFNHTNPVINKGSAEYRRVVENGFNVAAKGMTFTL